MNKALQWKRTSVIVVLALMLSLPFVTALQISDVKSEPTDNSAIITWNTDEDSNSFVDYGKVQTDLLRVGDASSVQQHSVTLENLDSSQQYFYKVESAGDVDDNSGNLYSFTTLAPDTTPPTLSVDIPSVIAGNKLDLEGTAEAGSSIAVYVDGQLKRSATSDGNFTVSNILLNENVNNLVRVDAIDDAGNTISVEGSVLSDTSTPEITLQDLPDIIDKNSVQIKGTVSEESFIAIILGDRTITEFEGTIIDQQVALREGENIITVKASDAAGLESTVVLKLNSDTKPPRVKFELEKGSEYYEGRANTAITGETEPGSNVYLFVYRSRTDKYTADFKRALENVTADKEGKFTFLLHYFQHWKTLLQGKYLLDLLTLSFLH